MTLVSSSADERVILPNVNGGGALEPGSCESLLGKIHRDPAVHDIGKGFHLRCNGPCRLNVGFRRW